jgi:hypothetical protein
MTTWRLAEKHRPEWRRKRRERKRILKRAFQRIRCSQRKRAWNFLSRVKVTWLSVVFFLQHLSMKRQNGPF